MKSSIFVALLFAIICLSGCAPRAVDMVTLSESTLEERQLQTRSFDTINETEILSASAATLQDLGFNIDEINSDFGLITCSKTRDAREIWQQVGAFFLTIFGGAGAFELTDHTQVIRATVVTTPKEINSKVIVRLNIQRVISNTKGNVIKIETINDPEIYSEFFGRLSKSLFLEANNL
ncbi:MAG: hypothetical protein LBQ18_02145 [Campylobacteraceae bacterium]|nr:hypothetical protein [Campylobacteraceae bacterium]